MPPRRTAVSTAVELARKRRKKKEEERKEEKVEEPVSKPAVVSAQPSTPSQAAGTFVSERTKKPSGITLPGGRTFLGLTPDEVREIQQREGLEELPPIGEAIALEKKREEAPALLEQAGAFEEVTPQRTELSTSGVEGQFIENIPVAGPVASAISNLISPRGFEGPTTPETIREQALRKIRDNSFREGTNAQVKFGTFIEGIPVAGPAVSKYVSGLIQTPSGNAEDITAELASLGEEATNNQEKTQSGKMPSDYAMGRARAMEEQLAELEGRLKYLVNISPVLQAETDNVNRIEQKIFETKQRVDNFRAAASFALTADITGTGRVVPTDEQLYLELLEQSK